MSKRKISKNIVLILLIIAFLFFVFIFPRFLFEIYAQNKLFDKQTTPYKPIAIVFGAGLLRDGSPTRVLEDRIITATDLYHDGKINKILMSGDNRFVDYNEPAAMKTRALELGVPEDDIVLDYAGRRTYDTCYRAKYIFDVKDAILITQRFHLPRAIFTCNKIGINAIGIPSDRRIYHRYAYRYWNIREVFASFVAFIDIYFTHPTPVLGEQEPIIFE